MIDMVAPRLDQPRRTGWAGLPVLFLLLAVGLAYYLWYLLPPESPDWLDAVLLLGVVITGVAGGVTARRRERSALERPYLRMTMVAVSVLSWMAALAAAAFLFVSLAFCSSYWPETWCGVPGHSGPVYPSDATGVAASGWDPGDWSMIPSSDDPGHASPNSYHSR